MRRKTSGYLTGLVLVSAIGGASVHAKELKGVVVGNKLDWYIDNQKAKPSADEIVPSLGDLEGLKVVYVKTGKCADGGQKTKRVREVRIQFKGKKGIRFTAFTGGDCHRIVELEGCKSVSVSDTLDCTPFGQTQPKLLLPEAFFAEATLLFADDVPKNADICEIQATYKR